MPGKGKAYNYCDTEIPDHMFYQPSCDWNTMPKTDPFTFGFGRGPYSVSRKCLAKRDLSSMSFEYMHKFWKTYPDSRKYF